MDATIKKIALLALAVLSLALAGGCGKQAEVAVVRVAVPAGFSEIYIAEALGYFGEEGVTLEYVDSEGRNALALVADDQADAFSGVHPDALAKAILQGQALKATAPGVNDSESSPHVRYIVKADSALNAIDELFGRKVGFIQEEAVSGGQNCAQRYLQIYAERGSHTGQADQPVAWVAFNNGQELAQSLLEGAVEAVAVDSHSGAQGLPWDEAAGFRVLGTSWDITHDPGASLTVNGFAEEFIKRNPKLIESCNWALYKARLWINAHPEEAVGLIAPKLGLSEEEQGHFTVAHYDDNSYIAPEWIASWVNRGEEWGLWPLGAVQSEDLYSNDYLRVKIYR